MSNLNAKFGEIFGELLNDDVIEKQIKKRLINKFKN